MSKSNVVAIKKDWWKEERKPGESIPTFPRSSRLRRRESPPELFGQKSFAPLHKSAEEIPAELALLAKPLFEFFPMPAPCVYFLVRGGRVVYIGQSVYLASRLVEHTKKKDFDRVYYITVPRDELDRVEGAFIRIMRPELNGKGAPTVILPQETLVGLGYTHEGFGNE